MIEQYVRDYLRDSDGIRDRVDEGTNHPGVYAGVVPVGHKGECIVVQAISAEHGYHLEAEIPDRQTVLQITTYSDKADRSYTLMELVRNRLSGYAGPMGDDEETTVKTCIILNDVGAGTEDPQNKSDKFVHSYTTDYTIIHTTPIPTFV